MLSYGFLFNINVFGFKANKLKTQMFGSRGGLQQNGFLFTYVLQNVKSYHFFWSLFGQILVDVQKHYKNKYFSTFLKANNGKQRPFLNFIIWSKVGLLSGPSWCPTKKANLDQIITMKICARTFFQKTSVKTLFYSFF